MSIAYKLKIQFLIIGFILLILCDTARDNDIAFESLEITTDSNNVDSDVLMNYLKENSTYEEEYTVYVNFEEYIDEILLVRMPGQPHRLIERIMKMIIENHLSHECRI